MSRQYGSVEVALVQALKLRAIGGAALDVFALIGILIAAASTFSAVALARPEIDGIGSVGIGLLLAVTSIFLARESKSLLMGEPVLAQKSNRPRDRFADEACGRRFLIIRPKR